MRINVLSLHSTLAALAALGILRPASAQQGSAPAPLAGAASTAPTLEGPAATPNALALTPAPPPAPLTATAAAPLATPTTAAGAAPSTPATDASKPVPSYFRIDHDYMFGLQLWAGATAPLTDSLGLATDIYIAENYPTFASGVDSNGNITGGATQSYWGEFDVGPSLTAGKLTLTAMVGVAFDWAARRAVAINGPQLYTVFSHDKFYIESWLWTFVFSAFKKDGPNDYVHTRNWVLYKLNDSIAFGPQLEYSYDLEAKQTIFGFPVGGHVELAYGAGNSLGLFLGYDTKKSTRGPDNTAAVGRLTFVHNF